MPTIYLGEMESALVRLALVAGAGLLAVELVNPKKTWHRATLLSISVLLALRYMWWRATQTVAPVGFNIDFFASWSLLLLEAASVLGSISAFVMLSRTKERSTEADKYEKWWGDAPEPKVAILIATYNEEKEVLERTIIGAKGLRHRNVDVYILDDGKRDWLKDLCEMRGVHYVTRPDNAHAKAGNINHALRMMAADPPEFVAVLDADFVPHRGFLSRTLALFHDDDVGLVQTPQHFFNADPIQHNFNLSRAYPDEQRFFFDTMQASRDAWDIAFCCGTSSIARWQALVDIGFMPTDSVTEDFMVTIVLQSHGWRTVYLNEAVTEGLAPEGLKEYVTQRTRWCLGMMQIARSKVGPFSPSPIRLRDRWSVLDAGIYWLTTFPFRIAVLVYPLLFWFFNVIVVDAQVPDVLSYFGVYYFWTIVALNRLSNGTIVPVLNDVSQLIGAIPITRAALTGLINPHGHPFKVTAKGGDRSNIQIQWRLMMPFLILTVLTVLGLSIGFVSDRFAYFDAGDGKVVVLFWTIYNLLVLLMTVLLCVELPRQEHHVNDPPHKVSIVLDGSPAEAMISGLTTNNVRIHGLRLSVGEMLQVQLKDVGDVTCTVVRRTRDGHLLQLLLTAEQSDALHLRLYAEDNVPGVTGVSLGLLASGLVRRLAFLERR